MTGFNHARKCTENKSVSGSADDPRPPHVGCANAAMGNSQKPPCHGRRQSDRTEQFNSIAASSPDAIICSDASNRILFWNPAAERIFGHSAEEALGKPLSIIIPPAMRPMHEAGFARFLSGAPSRLIGDVATVPAIRSNGSELTIELSLSHWVENGEHRFGAIARDITDRHEEEQRLKEEARVDYLTGIANRKTLLQRLHEGQASRVAMTLLMIDLDGFKDVNDSLGHAAGDSVLKTVAERLHDETCRKDLVSRLGGDEFVVAIEHSADPLVAKARAEMLIQALERPIVLDGRLVYVGACIGGTVAPEDSWTPDSLLGESDLALYAAKAGGRSKFRLFTPELRAIETTRVSLCSEMRRAWEKAEFELYYQPQMDLRSETIVGAEALIRWNHPERGVVGPGVFLADLEDGVLAFPVSEWILNEACRQAASWRSVAPGFTIGVNLFASLFRGDGLMKMVERALSASGLSSSALELEITENTILDGTQNLKRELSDLLAMGVGVAFDDYGTGYASLTMLKDYPVTRLKIDRSFVDGLEENEKNRAIVETVCKLADRLDLEVIAEGIETEAQKTILRELCAQGQGYLFGRPMPATQFEALLREGGVTAKEKAMGKATYRQNGRFA